LPSPLENNTASIGGKEGEDVHADVDDLMADLLDDDDDEDVETAKESAKDNAISTNEESLWLRSDRVDFKLYL
jgi:cobalamin biosynthesis protein CobT